MIELMNALQKQDYGWTGNMALVDPDHFQPDPDFENLDPDPT